MKKFAIALVATSAIFGGAALVSTSASAMPVGGLKAAADELSGATVQDVYWVCRRYHRCYWVGGYRYRHWGWRHHRRWW